jgi:hypothetical protein
VRPMATAEAPKKVRTLVRLKHALRADEAFHSVMPMTLAEFEEAFPGFGAWLEMTEGPEALATAKRWRRSPRRASSAPRWS